MRQAPWPPVQQRELHQLPAPARTAQTELPQVSPLRPWRLLLLPLWLRPQLWPLLPPRLSVSHPQQLLPQRLLWLLRQQLLLRLPPELWPPRLPQLSPWPWLLPQLSPQHHLQPAALAQQLEPLRVPQTAASWRSIPARAAARPQPGQSSSGPRTDHRLGRRPPSMPSAPR